MEFFTSDVCRVAGISRNLLQQWMDRGFVEPSHKAMGSGYKNVFSYDDLCWIILFQLMLRLGWKRSSAAHFLQSLRNVGGRGRPFIKDEEKNLVFTYLLRPGVKKDTILAGLSSNEDLMFYETQSVKIVINLEGIKKIVDNRLR